MRTLQIVAISTLLIVSSGAQEAPDTQLEQVLTAAQSVSLRVSVFNMTEATIRGKTEVWLRGQGSWFPNLSYGGDVTTFHGRKLGAIDSLYFYPFGRGGPEMMVPIEIDSALCPQACVRDMVNFEIYSRRFLAWGSPIDGHEIELKRR